MDADLGTVSYSLFMQILGTYSRVTDFYTTE